MKKGERIRQNPKLGLSVCQLILHSGRETKQQQLPSLT